MVIALCEDIFVRHMLELASPTSMQLALAVYIATGNKLDRPGNEAVTKTIVSESKYQ